MPNAFDSIQDQFSTLCLGPATSATNVQRKWLQDIDGGLLSSFLNSEQQDVIARKNLERRMDMLQKERNQTLQSVRRYEADIRNLKALERKGNCRL